MTTDPTESRRSRVPRITTSLAGRLGERGAALRNRAVQRTRAGRGRMNAGVRGTSSGVPSTTVTEERPGVEVVSGDAAVTPAVRTAAAWSWRVLLIGALGVAGVYFVWTQKIIVVPLAVALLLTVLLTPVRRFLEKHLRFPRALATATALIGMLVVVVGLITLAGNSVVNGIADLSDQAVAGFNTFVNWLAEGPLGLGSEELNQYLDEALGAVADNQATIVAGALGAATTVGHVVAGAVIALFCTFFFLLEGRTIWSWVVGLFPARARDRVHQAGRRGIVTLSAYVRTQILVAFVDGVGIGIGAAILGVPLALPLGILVFMGAFIPIVGAIVTGAVAVLVALVALGPIQALIMLGIVLLVQQVEGNVLQPFLMGHALSLHPVAVLLVVTAGGFAAGIIGALFAVPLAATINTVVLYLNGHDKFPELGTKDRIVIRGKPALPVAVARAEADLASDDDVEVERTEVRAGVAVPGSGSTGAAAPAGSSASSGADVPDEGSADGTPRA